MAGQDRLSLFRLHPPFRADHVGSLLRPTRVKEARRMRQQGRMAADTLRAIENEEIERIVARQKALGLEAVTDGELRRSWWHYDFLEGLQGVEPTEGSGIQFRGTQAPGHGIRVAGRLDFDRHPMLNDFIFLKTAAGQHTAKMTIPSPSMLHFRGQMNPDLYPDTDVFFSDLARTYQKAIRAFYDVGCRYLQLDDTAWAYLCSAVERQKVRDRGWDPEDLTLLYAETLRAALADRPADMWITMHVCRGNFRSTWIAEGGYESVAPTLFQHIPVDGFFLEYDSERAGGFEPLRHVTRSDLSIVLGLVTSKTPTIEAKDALKRRIEEASRYLPLNQLCLSPQCGFASTEDGNLLTEDQQWEKLAVVVDVAHEAWHYGY